MSYTDKHIVETYTSLFEGLSSINKIELIESLSKSLKTENTTKAKNFYKTFGSFESKKTVEEMIFEIKASRKFKTKDIKF